MSLYSETITELKSNNQVSELYRFQGAKSIEHFNIDTSRFNDSSKNSYIYFSKSLEHHCYFTVRRIRQLINREVLNNSQLQLTNATLANPVTYKKIKNLIVNSDKLKDLYSVRLITDKLFYKLITTNFYYQEEKEHPRSIERVDRRVLGGGYGIKDEWKELLSYLTYFYAYQKIDRYDILRLLSNMRKSGRVSKKDNILFLLDNLKLYNLELSQSMESDFTKFKIRNTLESIVEKRISSPTSNLSNNPSQVIKEVVDNYEKSKVKILSIFETLQQ